MQLLGTKSYIFCLSPSWIIVWDPQILQWSNLYQIRLLLSIIMSLFQFVYVPHDIHIQVLKIKN